MEPTTCEPAQAGFTLDKYRELLALAVEAGGVPNAPVTTWSLEHVMAVISLLPEPCVPADSKVASHVSALDARRVQLERTARKAAAVAKTAERKAAANAVPATAGHRARQVIAVHEERGAVRAAMPFIPRQDTLIGKYVCVGVDNADTNRERPILVPATDAFCAAWGDTSVSRKSRGIVSEVALTARSAVIEGRVVTESSPEFRTLATAYAVGEAVQGVTAPETAPAPMNARQRREAARIAAGKYKGA